MAEARTEMDAFEKGKRKARNWAIGIIIVMIGLFAWLKMPKPSPQDWGSSSARAAEVGPRVGDFDTAIREIQSDADWSPAVKNREETVLDDYRPVTKGVVWLIRFDKDPTKVYTMPPVDTPGYHRFVYSNNWNYIQWGIAPGSSKRTGTLTYHIGYRQ